ncbi:competence protein CoiA family protein [Clostridium butyricum]|uniref:competence protein CoiA family protein n=1 Tax=Clostridium butyricum TaxID=1492 RepID=UPI003D33A49B
MDIKLSFGIRDGRIIHISELNDDERGLKCNCTCPQCGHDLVARLGKIRTNHFAHINQECRYATETAIHKFAKEVLENNMKIILPQLSILYDEKYFNIVKDSNYNYHVSFIDQEGLKEVKITDEFTLDFDSIKLERRMGFIVPDVVVYKNGVPLIIEIAITHFIDDMKEKKIKGMDISTIEVDLDFDDIDYRNFDREKVEWLIINGIANKRWVYNRIEQIKKSEIQRKHEKIVRKHEKDIKDKIERDEKRKEIQLKKIEDLKANEESRLKEFDVNLENNKFWIQISKELNITRNNIPVYLNQKVNGEIAFNCDRRIWQSCIYKKFILNRKGKTVYICNVVRWVKSHSYLPRNKELDYTKDFDRNMFYSLTDAVLEFFNNLAEHGIIYKTNYKNNFYSSYEIKQDTVFIKEKKIESESEQVYVKDKAVKCIICDTVTSDWVVYYGASKNTCICRKCRLSNKG